MCVACLSNSDCDDGNACNGAETCNASGQCVAGTPTDCDDGVACTVSISNYFVLPFDEMVSCNSRTTSPTG